MANAISKSQIPYGVSFIQTSAGATITGEIKRYWTYKDMVTDPAPTRLASVANASRDEDYAVPEDHVGGVLYQRDFINSTWILIYTSKDLAVQTYVEWEHILNVPPWVGGVSNNRVKVTQDTFAVPRTTYYSYGPFKVMLPPVDKVQLGDEIVLEQYDNYGFVLFEQDERIPLTGREIPVVDMTTNKTYYVVYTYPEFKYEISSDTGNRVVTEERPISCNSFKFICTETDSGIRYWALTTDGDNLDSVVVQLRKEAAAHIAAKDPHPGYILKNEVQKYLLTNVKQATPERLGSVRLSVYEDIGKGAVGAIAVTPADLYAYLVNNYALKNHTHPQYALVEHTHTQYSVVGHGHVISDVDGLQSELDNRAPLHHTHEIDDVNQLWEELAKKQDLLAEDGTYIHVDGTTVNCTIPDASPDVKGIAPLVDAITDENRTSAEVAVSPAALMNAFKVEEHILHEKLFDDSAFPELKCYQNYGWMKFPFAVSEAYPGYCLAMAWGWSDVRRVDSDDPNYPLDLFIPINTAANLPTDSEGYCIFKKINHVEINPISNGGFADVLLTYLLAYGPKDASGNDVIGLNQIRVHAQPLINPSEPHEFQVYWKVIGYVSAYTNETWGYIDIDTRVAKASQKYTPSGDASSTKTSDSYFSGLTLPSGTIYRHHSQGEKGNTPGTITWTLYRVPGDGDGKYYLKGCMLVHARSNYKGGYAHAAVYVQFGDDSGPSVIDLTNHAISKVRIWKKGTGDSGTNSDTTGSRDIGTGATKTIASVTGHYEGKTRTTHAYLKVAFSDNAIQIVATCDSWSQHDGTTDAIQCYYPPSIKQWSPDSGTAEPTAYYYFKKNT